MTHSSESSAKLEYQKIFYKQFFYDLFKEIPLNVLEARFYKVQIKSFKKYTNTLDNRGYSRVFIFEHLNTDEKCQILESGYFHLVKALKTFPMEYLGDQIELKQTLDEYDFELVEESLLGAIPKAVDTYSNEFLEKHHKNFYEENYFNFLLSIIIKRISNRVPAESKVIKTKLYIEQLLQYTEAINKDKLPTYIDLRRVHDYEGFKKLFLKNIKKQDIQLYKKNKRIIDSWGLEIALAQLFSEVSEMVNEPMNIDVRYEWKEYCSNGQIAKITNSFIRELKNNEQEFFVFMPCNIGNGDKWDIPVEFGIRFIKSNEFVFSKKIPHTIKTHMIELVKSYSHFLVHTKQSKNKDFSFIKDIVNTKWYNFLDFINHHESLPSPYQANSDGTFAYSISQNMKRKVAWYSSGFRSQCNMALDNETFKKKVGYYYKILLPLTQSENDLATRLISSFKLYRESLELEAKNLSFSFGALWLCLEAISRDYKTEKVAQKLSFIPASLTDEFYTKNTVHRMQKEQILPIYQKRKKMFSMIIEELGELRNQIIFHRRDVITFQEWRLKKHLELLKGIVRSVQIVAANEVIRDASIKKIEDVKSALEKRI